MSTAAVPFVYDPFAPGFQDRPYATYRVLRDEHPAYRHPDREFYALSRFEDVWNAVHSPDQFSSEVDIGLGLLPMMIFTDPPRHDRLRAIVSRAFTPRRIAALEPLVADVAGRLLDAMCEHGSGDLMHEFAGPLPSTVIGELIGVPREQQPAFREWAEDLVEADPNAGVYPESAIKIYECFNDLLEARRRRPADDLMSALLAADIDGSHLTHDELLGFCFLLLVAGNDTTTNLIGNGTALLGWHPGQRTLLAATCANRAHPSDQPPALLTSAIEEMLRYESPAQALPRVTRTDIRLHDTTIEAGARVMLVWGAANHDEREFAAAERFDIHRRIERHLAFGHGIHYCLGAALARLEARAAFSTLLERAPNYELLDHDPPRIRSGWARAFATLPIDLHAP